MAVGACLEKNIIGVTGRLHLESQMPCLHPGNATLCMPVVSSLYPTKALLTAPRVLGGADYVGFGSGVGWVIARAGLGWTHKKQSPDNIHTSAESEGGEAMGCQLIHLQAVNPKHSELCISIWGQWQINVK